MTRRPTAPPEAARTPAPAWSEWHGDGDDPIRIGISSCLLGREVRYDGGHKRDRYLTDVLGDWVEWVPACPELEIGLGVPRPTIRLEGDVERPRLVMPSTGDDLTERMERYTASTVERLQRLDLDGYVLKKDSPSCGLERVRVYADSGMPQRSGVGVFTRGLQERWPHLPLEEEGRLNDAKLREMFIEHVFCRHRWRRMAAGGVDRGRLVRFHTAHKLLFRSHNEAGYRRLGRIVASAGSRPDGELFAAYADEMAAVLRTRSTEKRNANVLYHALGYLKSDLDPDEKAEAVETIEDYRRGLVPLVVPITLFRHHIRRHRPPYLEGQLYFEPHPKELMLRNRV